ncbi:NAD(P)/FAD-dependent oxidoreductase [Phytohabitans rumicis]|uniref:FAD-dependent catabolic D-arginine dehydrogenase DauA n=1 Tax=Phytohabitans rumicis TaxID=1076125 RepID=A0A6V8LHG9_9ACTN|nr:FAD-binding oxidoreductase [Phytohabitans rumicis]GFJ93537.1 FAD-dependent catabolic D-arginine dehydrogenase DauA [Phytohabitans rumicis]
MEIDFLVIGGGISGASAGFHLAAHGRVLLLEMEEALGYHATGRSAAFFSEYYGGPAVRALTRWSRDVLSTPPPGFTEYPLLTPRGVLTLCPAGAEQRFEAALRDGAEASRPAREIVIHDIPVYCPIVRLEWCRRAMVKPAAQDIDVNALHQAYLRGIRAAGGQVLRSARVVALARRGGVWHASTGLGEFRAPVVVNAAGAWADELAGLAGLRPVGLTPLRRTAFLVDVPDGLDATRWPMVADVTETFYFKPESGQLLVSPVDATPMPAGDVRPDDLDVASAAVRLEEATTLTVRRIRRAWAGLRTAAPDDVPVVGVAPDAPGFLWLAGLSGYGVQVAPAVGALIASLAVGATPADIGLDPTPLAPDRFTDRQASPERLP